MTKRPTRYGLPYKGSKNKIADWVCDQLPVADNFYDMFCGGCAVTHAQLVRGMFRRYIINDIRPELPDTFVRAAHGTLNIDYRWVSREEFFRRKDEDIIVSLCYSFGAAENKGYIYGEDIEDFKHDYHVAIVDGNVEPMKRWGYDLTPILRHQDRESRYLQAKPIIKSRVKRSDLISETPERLKEVERLQHLESCNIWKSLKALSGLKAAMAATPTLTSCHHRPSIATSRMSAP
jgi:hypothetical protein